MEKQIKVSYYITSPHRKALGDYERAGLERESPFPMSGINQAINFLQGQAVAYEDGFLITRETLDFQTNRELIRTFHLEGFSDEEKALIEKRFTFTYDLTQLF